MIIAGSSFPNFVPETGVNLKQSGDVKSGGTDFLSKYKKISLEQYEKALLLYNNKEIPNLILNIILYCFLKIVNNQLIFKLC